MSDRESSGPRGFLGDESGSGTIEFVLWVPIIVALLVMVVDATTLYVTHKEMWNVARDTARRMVTGAVMTEDQAEAYAIDAMSLRDYPYAVRARYDVNVGAEVVIALRVEDTSILSYFSPLQILGHDMVARVLMRADPNVPFGTVPPGGGGGGGGPGRGGPP